MNLDVHAQKYLYELLGERQTQQLLGLSPGTFDKVLVEKIRERGLRERRGPRYSLEVRNGS